MKKRIIALILAAITVFGMLSIPANAATISDGSKTCTVQNGPYHRYLSTTAGNTVGGGYRYYKTNDGITGPAYCIDWGLSMVPANKQLAISRYTSSPKTIGAFANGYPQRTLEEFLKLYLSDNPALKGLTEDEYAYATQVAVWATLGQLGVQGTSFTAGRATIVKPANDVQKVRIYTALSIILRLANGWDKQLYSGMYLRSEENALGAVLEIKDGRSLEDAANSRLQGIQKETINGQEYYTRKFWAASATSTWPFDNKIGVWFSGAPTGTLVTDAGNNVLPVKHLDTGGTVSLIPTEKKSTSLNVNGEEYSGAFKLCLPVDNVTEGGEIGINLYGTVSQYVIYLADNPSTKEQSYIIADPSYNNLTASGKFIWGADEGRDTARISVMKVDGGNKPLAGAEFSLEGSDGSVYTGKTGPDGLIEWDGLDPDSSPFILRETKAPEGYGIVDPINIKVTEGNTSYVTVRDDTDHSFRVKKIDAQNGYSLRGAVFRFEQIDGSFVTTGTTGHDGIIEFTGKELPFGSYRVSEQSSPEGYLKDTRIETVEWTGEKDILLTFENVREMRLILLKKNETGASLSDATFDIYADGKYLTSVTTNDDGEAYVTGIKAEMYIEAVEKIAPVGHVLDRTSHGIHIDPYNPAIEDDPVLTVVNQSRPSLRIIKFDRKSNTKLSGATFEIYKDTELFDTKTTPESGEIDLFDLEPGTYLVKEVSVGDTHIVNTTPQQIELKAGQTTTQELVFFNDLRPGIHLIKVDSADLSKPIANARFRFEAVDGSWGPQELTTLEDGTIDLSKLPTGAVVVTELECPGYVIDDAQRIMELKPNEDAQFVFTNSKLPSLHLLKTSSDGTPLAGVSFRLAKIEDGTFYLDRTTSATGEILWEGLEPGVYSLHEISSVPDHIRDLKEYHVELFPGMVSEKVLTNDKRPNLYVYKNDADDGSPIENTIFIVRAADGHSIDEIETDSTGRAELKNLLPGVYEISEKSVPSPWLKDAPSQLVTLYPNRDHTAYFKNHKRPVIEIIKENAVTFERLANVPFRVWYASNNTATGEMNDLGVFYTDEDGRIELDGTKMGTLGLRDGWFQVQELEPLTGFAKADPDIQEAFVPAGQGHTFRFRNQPLSAICVWKYDSQQPNVAIEGAVFQIRYLSGNTSGTGGTVIGTYQTSKNGSFTATGLKRGTYIIEELSSDESHVIDTSPQTVYLSGEEQEVIQVYFGNSAKGALLVTKVGDDGEPLSGVEFLVTKSDGTLVGDANGKFTTGQDGSFLVENVEPNTTLVVKETRTKLGYLMDDVAQTAVIKAGQTVKLQFVNHKQGNLIIHKLSSLDKTPLEGAQFKLTYANGEVVDAADGKLSSNGLYTSNSEGQIVISNITGTVVATEVSSAPGFAIDPNTRTQTVVINPGGDTQHLYFYNAPLCSLTLTKLDSISGKPVPNTTFTVKYASGEQIGRYTTGNDGTVTVTGLLPGSTVIVTEYKVPDTHVLNPTPQTITLKSGANTVTSGTGSNQGGGNNLDFENDPKMVLTIRKYIKGTDYEPLKGVCFKVVDGYGKPIGTNNGVYYTSSAGEIILEDLEPGTTVTAREISTVEGFVLDGEPQTVTIRASKKPQEMIFWNERAGSLVIQKKSSLDGSPLAGVQFLLTYADGSYVDYDNGHMSSKGLYETDSAGEIRITGITGTVIAKEVKCLPGFTIAPATQTQTVIIRPDDCQTLVFYNTPIGGIEIIKVDEADTSQRIPNVTFEIRRMDGALVDTVTTGADGRVFVTLEAGSFYAVETACPKEYKLDSTPHYFEVISGKTTPPLTVTNHKTGSALIRKVDSLTGEGIFGVSFLISDAKGNPIGTYQSDNEGYVLIDKELADGKYTARELECAPGYILDTQPKTFYVKYGGCTTITWPNTAVRGQIQVIKKSADYNPTNGLPAGAPLEGATFEIYNERNGNKVDTIVSGPNGLASSKQLPLGRYQIRETKAPSNYGASSETYTAVLEYSGQIVKLEITNKSLSTGVSIEKTGPKEATSGQPVRYVFSRIGNTSNVMLQSFYWRDTLPAAVRLDKVVTGTYNFPGTYKIVYKVNNTGDYRTLADSLSTNRNYTLAASPTALGLAANERVTEIMFVFGQVPGGFAQVEAPMLYCTAVSGLAPGSSFVNIADAGGTYNGVWVQAVTRWVTTVYGKPTPLPRTGY